MESLALGQGRLHVEPRLMEAAITGISRLAGIDKEMTAFMDELSLRKFADELVYADRAGTEAATTLTFWNRIVCFADGIRAFVNEDGVPALRLGFDPQAAMQHDSGALLPPLANLARLLSAAAAMHFTNLDETQIEDLSVLVANGISSRLGGGTIPADSDGFHRFRGTYYRTFGLDSTDRTPWAESSYYAVN